MPCHKREAILWATEDPIARTAYLLQRSPMEHKVNKEGQVCYVDRTVNIKVTLRKAGRSRPTLEQVGNYTLRTGQISNIN